MGLAPLAPDAACLPRLMQQIAKENSKGSLASVAASVLTDASEDAVVRHKAAEVLAAIDSGHRLDSAERGALH